MDLLVTGGSGLIGYRLIQSLRQDYSVAYTYNDQAIAIKSADEYHLDIRNADRVRSIIEGVGPEFVVHAAAMTDVDGCERNPEMAYEINVEGTEHVVKAAQSVDARTALFSSGFIFDGSEPSYGPTADPAPINVYGETKLAAERIVLREDDTNVVLRTDQPFGWSQNWQSPTMVEWVLRKLEQGDAFEVFGDWSNCPIYLLDLVAMTRAVIEHAPTGIYHCVGPDFVSRYEWALRIAEVFGFSPSLIQRSESTGADLPAERPNVNLAMASSIEALGIRPRTLNDALVDMRNRCAG